MTASLPNARRNSASPVGVQAIILYATKRLVAHLAVSLLPPQAESWLSWARIGL